MKEQDYVASYRKVWLKVWKDQMFVFLESNRDNLEQVREQIADIKEKLDTLMKRLPLEEKKPRMEGKIFFFFGGGGELL